MTRKLAGILSTAVGLLLVNACVVGERPSIERIQCTDGACVCSVGFGNCDGDAGNGCESVLEIDPKNCGACGTACVNGTCEAGSCTCSEGFFDCNGAPEDGCEGLVRADPNNCGECGRSCQGGDCASSRCAPYLVAELGTYIYSLASNDSDVFYCDAESGVIYRVNKVDVTESQLVLDQNCYAMAASGDHLFWSVRENGDELIRRVPTGGGDVATIAVAGSVDSFVPVGNKILWSEYDDVNLLYQVFSADALGTTAVVAQSTERIRDLVASGNRIYWIEGERLADMNLIRTAPVTGGLAATLVTTDMQTVEDIEVIADQLYWLQTDEEGEEPTISRVRTTGGASEELYVRNREVENLLGDATGLYWTEDQGDRWMRAPVDGGGEVEVLAEFLDITLPVLGNDSLLWIDFPNHLFALAK